VIARNGTTAGWHRVEFISCSLHDEADGVLEGNGSVRKLLVMAASGMLVGAVVTSASAQQAALPENPQVGRRLARDLCETCPIVAADQEIKPLVSNYAPGFYDVANRPDVSAASTETFLLNPHRFGHMPFPELTDVQEVDLASYILSLRGRH
jgi:hypothetical protein